jgi:hypothetical protein
MSSVNNQGVRIHYEVEGQGPPLVMQYGQYFPLEIWYELNYVNAPTGPLPAHPGRCPRPRR